MFIGVNNSTDLTILDGGNVGIGTDAPGYQLDLRRNDTGTTTSLGIRQLGSGDASMAFQTTTDPFGICIGVDGSESDAFKIATGNADVGTNTKFKIDTSGNVTFAGGTISGAGSATTFTSGANEITTIDAGNAGVQIQDLAKVGSPTGGFKTAGTLNAVGVFDDNSLLSCYVFDQAVDGAIDNKKWDDKVLDRPKGTDGKSDYEARSHQDMRKFKERIGTDTDPLDIDKYSKHWKDKKHLTSMPNEEKFNLEEGMTVGSWVQRLIETVEIQAVHISNLNDRITVLES